MSNILALCGCAVTLISIMVTSFAALHGMRSVQHLQNQKRRNSPSGFANRVMNAQTRDHSPPWLQDLYGPQIRGTSPIQKRFQKRGTSPIQKRFPKRATSPTQKRFQKRATSPIQKRATLSSGPEAMARRVKSAIYVGYLNVKGKNQDGSLAKFRALARNNRWDMIGYATGYQFDWWVFPTPRSGLYPEFRVSTDRHQQGRFYRSLLNDRRYVRQFQEMCNYVALSWGWNLRNNRNVQNKTTSQKRPVYALRYYKMLKCLALMNRHASRQNKLWIQKFYHSMTTGPSWPHSGVKIPKRRFDNTIRRAEWKIIHSQYGINNRDWFGID